MNKERSEQYKGVIQNNFVTFLLVIAIPVIQIISTPFFFGNEFQKNIFNAIISFGIVIGAFIYLIAKLEYANFIDYWNNKTDFEFLFDVFLKNVYVVKETLEFTIDALPKKDSPNINSITKISRTIILKNLNDSLINQIYLPWFYSIYNESDMDHCMVKSIKIYSDDRDGKREPVGREIKKPGDDLLPYLDQSIMVTNPLKPGETEATGWIRAPVFLKPQNKTTVDIHYQQNHIFDKIFTNEGESAGTVIAIPTKELEIIVRINQIDGKTRTIIPKDVDITESILISNKSLNLKDNKEIVSVNPPEFFKKKAIWTIEKPKVGYLYQLLFKVEEVENEPFST